MLEDLIQVKIMTKNARAVAKVKDIEYMLIFCPYTLMVTACMIVFLKTWTANALNGAEYVWQL